MYDIREIDAAISQLEKSEPTWPRLDRLASLYTVRDRLIQPAQHEYHEQQYSAAGASDDLPIPLPDFGDSDFMRSVIGKDPAAVWDILDDLMDTLELAHPKAYASVMFRLQKL